MQVLKPSSIKIFETCKPEQYDEVKANLTELVKSGRLPITQKNIEIIRETPEMTIKNLINQKSASAGLTMIGFDTQVLKHSGESVLCGYDDIGTILFVNSHTQKDIV